ncbi:uncharacterized protein LOC132296386 [Cornus florida]|uniref:uncharacterized protein LOC132296386 n=1 Tax=Cornus florida TaxID=4283 RepID=UPI0028A0F0B6|nr:uncharacterized protein LOC132296386 [Cornus florida]
MRSDGLFIKLVLLEGMMNPFKSSNRANFIEMVKAFASYNDDVARIVLENAPKNAKKVRSKIREDIGNAKFCILIDEARDESKREQTAFVLRYVDKDGFLQERFFDLVHVKDTTSLNLKKDLCAVLSHYNLDVHNLRGQGYDGASNMRGGWNALQQKDHDIVNAMQLVSSTKQIILKLRENGWNKLLDIVKSFCECHNIDVPDLSVPCTKKIKGQLCHPQENITLEHHYRIDIFYGTIDSQLQKLNNKFSEKAMKLVTLSSALDPRDGYKFFNIEDICTLVDEFYPQDFTDQERIMLTFQLQHYEVKMPVHSYLKNMSTISELCRGLVETKKSKIYFLIDRLIRLVLTLPVSTATTERAFSTMKLVRTQLHNRMEDEFLADYLSVSIEKEIAHTFSTDSIIDDFSSLKECQAQLL